MNRAAAAIPHSARWSPIGEPAGLIHAAGLTTTDGAAPLAFELAGSDKVFHPATAVLDGNTVTVSAPDVPQPRYVRYAWRDSPPVNLVNGAGLPAVPFRTDRD